MNDFLRFRECFFRLWYKVAPQTIVTIDFDTINFIITIKIKYITLGNFHCIDRIFNFNDTINCHNIVEHLLFDYINALNLGKNASLC